MRNHDNAYQLGKNINGRVEQENEMDLFDLNVFSPRQHAPENRENGFYMGTMGKMEEGEESNSIITQNDEEARNAAMEQFAGKIKKAVSAKLMGKKLNLVLKGHPNLVKQVTKMIKYESEYLNALISGQAPDTPALQKNKAIIDSEANKLDRMLQTSGFWPFK
jgi:hypothetical protein